MVSQTQPALLAGTYLLCVIFYHVFCEIWINCGYVWLRCCRIGDKCMVLFLKMWEIGVCSIAKILCDQSDLITEAPWLSYHWPTCCTTPLDGRTQGRPLWVATIPSTVNTAQNIRDFALWYSRFSVDCLLAAPMVVGAAFLMLKCISSYLDCQYDSLSIDKCSIIGHRGPRCEGMLTNEEFIMIKKYFCVRNDNYIYPLIIIKRNSNLSITHS